MTKDENGVGGSVEEKPTLGFALGRIVDLPINIFLEIVGGREWTRLGKLSRLIGLGARVGVDLLGGGFGEHAFVEQHFLKKINRILRALIIFDLGAGAVGLVRIG